MPDLIPTATVLAYSPPSRTGPATVRVACPYCTKRDRWRRPTAEPGEHHHGIGLPGGEPNLGSRVAHCATGPGGVYDLVDHDNRVPQRIELAPA